jgi:hypothetical protein
VLSHFFLRFLNKYAAIVTNKTAAMTDENSIALMGEKGCPSDLLICYSMLENLKAARRKRKTLEKMLLQGTNRNS